MSCGASDRRAFKGTLSTHGGGRDRLRRPSGDPDFFGEKALMSRDVCRATCFADAKCLTLLREDFVRRLGKPQDLLNGPPRRRPST